MSEWSVIPTIRVRDMGQALDFYRDQLGFTVDRGGPDDNNCSLSRGDAHIMIEVPADLQRRVQRRDREQARLPFGDCSLHGSSRS